MAISENKVSTQQPQPPSTPTTLNNVNSTPNRVSIKEANDHLRLLHHKVSQLESIIQLKNDELMKQEEQFNCQYRELKAAKESQINELSQSIIRLEDRIKDLEKEMKIKNAKLEDEQHRLTMLDEFIVTSVPCLQNLVNHIRRMSLNDTNCKPHLPAQSSKAITTGDEDDEPQKDESISADGRVSSGIGMLSDSNGSASDASACNGDFAEIKLFANGNSNNADKNESIEVSSVTATPLTSTVTAVSSTTLVKKSISNGAIQRERINCNEKIPVDTEHEHNCDSEGCRGEPSHSIQSESDKCNILRNSRSTKSHRKMHRRSQTYANSPSKPWSPSININNGTDLSLVDLNPIHNRPKLRNAMVNTALYSSNNNISGKVARSFSITSNFSEDEEIPSISGFGKSLLYK